MVYHYSGYEVAKIRGSRRPRAGDPLLDWAAAYAEEQFVDLLEIVKTHYFGVAGLGLKLMAAHAGLLLAGRGPGRAELPGLVRRGGARRVSARPGPRPGSRVLEYNEDDVDRHLPAQSVVASAVIAAFSVRRWGPVDHRLHQDDATAAARPPITAQPVEGQSRRVAPTPAPAASAAKSTRVRRTEQPLDTPRQVPRQTRAQRRRTCSRHRHWPPPPAGRGPARSPAASRPVRSCSAVRSPTRPVVGRPVARAIPAAVERFPSIPASPRLAIDPEVGQVATGARSRSRTGEDEPTNTTSSGVQAPPTGRQPAPGR